MHTQNPSGNGLHILEKRSLMDILISPEKILLSTERVSNISVVYVSTGKFVSAADTVTRMPEVYKEATSPLVLIVSDWEELAHFCGRAIQSSKELAKMLGVPYIIIMASQANLIDPWLSWVKKNVGNFMHIYLPKSMKT